MKIIRIRPSKGNKREKAAVALYTVAFIPDDLRLDDDSFALYCKEYCKYGIIHKCRAQCNKGGEYGRLMHIWEKRGYLIDLFQRYCLFLKEEFKLTIEQAILRHEIYYHMARTDVESGDVSRLFVPLYEDSNSTVVCPDKKYVASFMKSDSHNWLRLYAVKYQDEDNKTNYIITGGAIKLSKDSAGVSSISDEEERKMNSVIKYLETNNITSRFQIERVVFQARTVI